MLRTAWFLMLLAFAYGSAQAADPLPMCAHDPSERVAKSVVGIERMFDPDEVFVNENLVRVFGSQGTAWFLDSTTLATISHVATGMKLTGQWKEITIFWSDKADVKREHELKTFARIKDIVKGIKSLEPIVTLELQTPFPNAVKAVVSGRTLRRNEAVIGIGYAREVLRIAQGRLALPDADPNDDSSEKPPPPYLPFEMVDTEKDKPVGDRYALNRGASGGPLFNCRGEVVSVLVVFLTKDMTFGDKTIEITTPWGHPNNLGVSSTPLLDLKK